MPGFVRLLKNNRNYRYTWLGQIVSEIGDHFNNIAVLSLALHNQGSGLAVAGVMLARALPAIVAGPLAGVALDRFNRRNVMIASDLARAVVAMCFMLCIGRQDNTLLFLFSALLMFASPFFSSGRSSILPAIANKDELHTASSTTQTTMWLTTAIGAWGGGLSVAHFGYPAAFFLNAVSFFFSAWAIWNLKPTHGEFDSGRDASAKRISPWKDYVEGLRYIRSIPLLLGICMISVGWATGGGAAQILFTLFGERVFLRGPAGTGTIWGCAGIGLVIGGITGHLLGKRINFSQYKRTVGIVYLIHGGGYVIFSLMTNWPLALFFIALSRAGTAVSSVLNGAQVLQHTANAYRGRVASTIETLTWSTMLLSMAAAGFATRSADAMTIRHVGVISGILSGTTAIWWTWANLSGKLREPAVEEQEADVELHDRAV